MPDINTCMRYMSANPSTDQTLAQALMDASVMWLANAGVEPRTNDALYDLAVYMLTTHYFDNRGVIADTNAPQQIPMGVMSIMHQLRLVPTDDGGGSA